jgi:hypothetical protein
VEDLLLAPMAETSAVVQLQEVHVASSSTRQQRQAMGLHGGQQEVSRRQNGTTQPNNVIMNDKTKCSLYCQ